MGGGGPEAMVLVSVVLQLIGTDMTLLRKRIRCVRIELHAKTTVLTMTRPHPNPLPPGGEGTRRRRPAGSARFLRFRVVRHAHHGYSRNGEMRAAARWRKGLGLWASLPVSRLREPGQTDGGMMGRHGWDRREPQRGRQG